MSALGTAMWSRFIAAGRRLQSETPELWPLLVQLIEGAAEPEALTGEDLHELAAVAAHTAWTLPAPRAAPISMPPISPARALADWQLIDQEAHAVPLKRMEMLMPESLALIAEWARAVARSRTDPSIDIPPTPPIAVQLLVEIRPEVKE